MLSVQTVEDKSRVISAIMAIDGKTPQAKPL